MLSNRSRLADLDGRLQGILDHLTQKDSSMTTPAAPELARSANTSESGATTSRSSAATTFTEPSDATPSSGDENQSDGQPVTSPGWMSRLALDHHLVDHLLQRFRATQHYFPFVIVPATWTVASMLESHATLLLAAVTVASVYYPRLQHGLSEEFHSLITTQVLKADGTSLDLLQGIMVYLAW